MKFHQGRQFESNLFHEFSKSLGTKRIRTCAYHPQSNGLIENFHRTLKTAITSGSNPTLWAQLQLPIILLILHTSINTNTKVSPAEALYGQELRLPGDVFTPNPSKTPAEISGRVLQATESLNNVTHHDTKRVFHLPPALPKCSHVFVRDDRVKKPFTAPYYGPFKVLDRNDKHYYTLAMRSKPTPISIDRLKPC